MAETGNQVEKTDAVKREEAVLAFWKENRIFEKSLEKAATEGDFIFYEGPPTANGRPGVHHMESRSFKDAIPRYKTMRGYRVPRRAGWDTHGLPVELEVEKKLGFTGKPDIEKYGVAEFNKKCRESVFEYIEEWGRFTDRVGYWVDQSKAYFTFDAPFMESVWSVTQKIWNDGRMYKDYKVLPWCSRCGTALSTHELAQGYADVKDLSVTVKFKVKNPEVLGYPSDSNIYLIAWTTTPWTLPGNVGLAIGKDIEYVMWTDVKEGVGTESYIIAAPRFNALGIQSGAVPIAVSQLLQVEYEPLYPFAEALASETEKPKFANAFKVYPADFVTTEDGTGIVHTAVMYGQEDFELGTKVGLPKVHLVAPDGTFVPGTGFLEGRFVKEEDANGKPTLAVDIIDDLKKRNLFFSQENHLHSYPFCWRCKTPLIYYARDSWYIRMSDLRPTLVAENQKVNWEPAHIRDGRMGEWLAGDKDWAISRERYWGTPLPIWQNEDGTERILVGSVEELKQRTKKSGNTYFLMRHGEAENNVQNTLDCTNENKWPLTEEGRKQAEEAAAKLKDAGITKIVASPFERTKETAACVAKRLGLSESLVTYDDRLREFNFGALHGGPLEPFTELRRSIPYTESVPGGESDQEAKRRFGEFLYELERTTSNEKILIVTHGAGFEALCAVLAGATKEESRKMLPTGPNDYIHAGWVEEVNFVPLPHNDDYELDLHRPYIDDVVLLSDTSAELRRVKEVMDVWFDSGSMPFAQDHYPFENKEWVEGTGYPADFISEAIDQTRGWFYTLLAVGVLMERGTPYKNVICLGHLLDEKGQKMSKSKGNVINPWEAIEKFGADTLRFWMYSVNQPGDSKNFDEKTVTEVANKVFNPFVNALAFYQSYADEAGTMKGDSSHVVDRWIRARFAQTADRMTTALDAYDLFTATRELREFVGDLSQWYVRRSRDRMRGGEDAQQALGTLRSVLSDTAKLMAPFAPFTAEHVYRAVRIESDPESVHLTDWPTGMPIDESLIDEMTRVRSLASQALQVRQKAGVVLRQPLARLSVPGSLSSELIEILAEEVNVKEVLMEQEEIGLDTVLTPELVREGDVRAFMRALADARKDMDLSPKDSVQVQIGEAGKEILEGVLLAGTSAVTFDTVDGPYTVDLSTGKVSFSITRDAS